MGMSTEQTVRVIEAVGDVIAKQPEPVVKEPNYWWIPIAVAVITMIGGIITAFIRRRK